jgi:hypothetical protein
MSATIPDPVDDPNAYVKFMAEAFVADGRDPDLDDDVDAVFDSIEQDLGGRQAVAWPHEDLANDLHYKVLCYQQRIRDAVRAGRYTLEGE